MGSIVYRKDRGLWCVKWWYNGKQWAIYRYKGEYMFHRRWAEKLLATIQNDWENHVRGHVEFRIEKYTKEVPTDVVLYLWEWLEGVSHTLSPATYKDYENSIKNHLEPFFKQSPVQLHEVQLDVLTRLLGAIKRKGKGKLNVMYCLHACLDYAWRSRKIDSVPPFPKRREYGVVKPIPQWVPEERQDAIINAIPKEHQAIFWWLKYHLRRPAEACALYREDFTGDTFIVRRTFSNKILVNRTKTGKIHVAPCHSDFRPVMEKMSCSVISPFFFVNPHGRLRGKHYTLDYVGDLWRAARARVGEHISLYPGTKHSRATFLHNECGLSLDELQIAGGWARRDSVTCYAETKMATRRRLLEAKVVRLVRNESKGGLSR